MIIDIWESCSKIDFARLNLAVAQEACFPWIRANNILSELLPWEICSESGVQKFLDGMPIKLVRVKLEFTARYLSLV